MSTLYVDTINEKTSGNGIYIPGHVVQIQSTHKTDTASSSSTSFVDVTGLSVTITPSSSASKILLIASVSLGYTSSGFTYFRLMRDSTVIDEADTASNRPSVSGQNYDANEGMAGKQVTHFLDSPATTSAVTYKVQIKSGLSGYNVYVNRSHRDNDTSDYDPRFASSITVMEIGG